MKTLLRALILVCLIAGLFASTPARAQEDGPADPADPSSQQGVDPLIPLRFTRHLTLVGSDFHPSISALTYSSTEGGIYPLQIITIFGFYAPLHFPKGAIVTGVDLFFIDSEQDKNISFSIRSFAPASDTSTDYAIWSSASFPNSTSIQTASLSDLNVPILADTAYRARVVFEKEGGSQVLKGLRITYTVPLLSTGDTCITVAGGDFLPSRSDLGFGVMGNHQFITNLTTPPGLLIARVDLPDGALVNKIMYYYMDNATENLRMSLYSKNPGTAGWVEKEWAEINAASSSVQSFTRTGSPIFTADATVNSYALGIELRNATDNKQRIVAGQVCYTPPAATTGMQTRTYAGSSFRPTGSSLGYLGVNGSIYATTVDNTRSFQANLNLPDGVMVHKVTYYVTDLSNDQNFLLAGRTYVPSTGQYADPFQQYVSFWEPSAALRAITFAWPVKPEAVFDTYMDNYRLRVVMSGNAQEDLMLHGAQVEYYTPRFVYIPVTNK